MPRVWPAEEARPGLSLPEVRRRVLDYNETIQMQALEVEISRKTYQAERGIFEPQVTGSLERVDNRRPNNAQQQLGLFGVTVLDEQNTIYNGGLEFLLPSGARLQTGLSLRDLSNNLGGRLSGTATFINEYESFAGATLVQPILKNAGVAATMARIRLAAVASDLAYQEYRRQLMLLLSQAEASYWDLFLTQEQDRISFESVELARTILKDNQTRLEVGKSSALEVLEAESGLSLRQARRRDAELKVFEGANRLASLFSDATPGTNWLVRASDQPPVKEVSLDYFDNFKEAFQSNPDFLSRQKTVEQENIRLAYALNQRLPQLDLKASYGLNGLGQSPSDSVQAVGDADFPTWSVGVEMRIPLLGGIQERNQLDAARLRKKQALISLKEIEVQIVNALDAALHRVRSYLENIGNYRSVVQFHEKLLETQLASLEVGKIDSRTVLETEEKLFATRIAELESMVQYQRAILEMELIKGKLLEARGVELTKDQLEEKTRELLRTRRWSEAELARVQRDVAAEYEHRAQSAEHWAAGRARDALRDSSNRGKPATLYDPESAAGMPSVEELQQRVGEISAPASPPPAYDTDAARQNAVDALRRRMKELGPSGPVPPIE